MYQKNLQKIFFLLILALLASCLSKHQSSNHHKDNSLISTSNNSETITGNQTIANLSAQYYAGSSTKMVPSQMPEDFYSYNFAKPRIESHLVSTSVFLWYSSNGGQQQGPWHPLEGREAWSGDKSWWKTQIKQMMMANINLIFLHLATGDVGDLYPQERTNFFAALNELRKEGYDVPLVSPFLDYFGSKLDFSQSADKEKFINFYVKFFENYYLVNNDEYADHYLGTINNKIIIDIYFILNRTINLNLLEKADIENRLRTVFAEEHPIFNNGIYFISNGANYHAGTENNKFNFFDELIVQFESNEYFHPIDLNVMTAQIKAGYWDQNVRDPGSFVPRSGGIHYKNAWNQVLANKEKIKRVYIESWNEYDEGSGIFAADPSTHFSVRNTDLWSLTNNPYEYISTTANGAKEFNDYPDYDARILWHNIPSKMIAGEVRQVQVVVRNMGDLPWTGASNFRFGQTEYQDKALFGAGRFLINDLDNEITTYQGIFRGRPMTFTFTITAPLQPGEYLTHWGMLREHVLWFGEMIKHNITVSTHNALFITQTVPTTMVAGKKYQVSLIFKNAGDTSWTVGDKIRLGSQNIQDNNIWGIGGRVELLNNETIAPQQEKTFRFEVLAPSNAGRYTFQWQMLQEHITWFGTKSTNLDITVTTADAFRLNSLKNTQYHD